MKTIRSIIDLVGGAKAVADATQGSEKEISTKAVHKWMSPGGTIPEVHWSLIIRLAEEKGHQLTAEDLFDANSRARQGRSASCDVSVAGGEGVRVSA